MKDRAKSDPIVPNDEQSDTKASDYTDSSGATPLYSGYLQRNGSASKENRGVAAVTHSAFSKSLKNINNLVKGLLAGRFEHELRPSIQSLLNELSACLNSRELELLKKTLLRERVSSKQIHIQGVITSLLKSCFEQLEGTKNPELSKRHESHSNIRDYNFNTRVLSVLRDLALEIVAFLDRSEADGITDLYEIWQKSIQKFRNKAEEIQLSQEQENIARHFLLKVSCAVFADKLELVAADYLVSGTDFNLVSGKVWASRYSRADYMPFLFSSIQTLESENKWLFEDKTLIQRILALQVQIKAESLKSELMIDNELNAANQTSLQAVLLELRMFFGIAINCLFRDEGEQAKHLLERVLTCSADALEHKELDSVELSKKLSRIRVQAYYCLAEAEILDAAKQIELGGSKSNSDLAEQIYKKKESSLKRLMQRVKSELELLGLSGISIDIDGTSHSGLEGLNEWVMQVCQLEEASFLAELAMTVNKPEIAHANFCRYLSVLSGFGIDNQSLFVDLSSSIKIHPKNGSQKPGLWGSRKLASYPDSFLAELSKRLLNLPLSMRERFISVLPVLVGLCFDFADFDKGYEYAVAHRHMMRCLLDHSNSTPDFELLYSLVDAEVRSNFKLYSGEMDAPERSAFAVIAELKSKEQKGFFRDIDRNRETKLVRSVVESFDISALKELNDFKEKIILKSGIHGQFVSQEIRMLRENTLHTRKKGQIKVLGKLVRDKAKQRLDLSKSDLESFLKDTSDFKSEISVIDQQKYIQSLNTESKAQAAVQMYLDAAMTALLLRDYKFASFLIKESYAIYGKILPDLERSIENILAARSQEELRRRVEAVVMQLTKNVSGGQLSLVGARSGAELGFLNSQKMGEVFKSFFDQIIIMASVSRRRVVAGRCRPLQRYIIAHSWTHIQRRIVSSLLSINNGL